jgi:hypothetical protein
MQIEASLVWQAKTSLIGRDVFHDLASARDIIMLHKNIHPATTEDFIENAVARGFLKYRDGICEYVTQVPAGPDWHPTVW